MGAAVACGVGVGVGDETLGEGAFVTVGLAGVGGRGIESSSPVADARVAVDLAG